MKRNEEAPGEKGEDYDVAEARVVKKRWEIWGRKWDGMRQAKCGSWAEKIERMESLARRYKRKKEEGKGWRAGEIGEERRKQKEGYW